MKSLLPTYALPLVILLASGSCEKQSEEGNNTTTSCDNAYQTDDTRGACTENLSFTPQFSSIIVGSEIQITTNCIPAHMVGLFGGGPGSLNPNAISPQNESYTITLNPQQTGNLIPLLDDGPQYSFGVLFNGVEVDPIAAEPFPHEGVMSPNVNWEWNLEALNVNLGLDCNNAHVQPSGKYHYHGSPILYLQSLNVPTNTMTMVGYAADGFPIYYKYAYTDAQDTTSAVMEMLPSYQLKDGDRPGDGVTAPCGAYNGAYSNDYEYSPALGQLDEANGRTGITPEYPNGTYYYMITDDFPSIPRYFVGTPSSDFRIGP